MQKQLYQISVMKKKTIFLIFLLTLFSTGTIQAAPADTYKIEQLRGNVYRFVNDRHRSVFLVTTEGILLTDPMNPKAAAWLQKELQERFQVPIKYVVYSHNHSDHIYGAEIFKNTQAVFISSQITRDDLLLTRAKTVIPDISFEKTMYLSFGENKVELRYHGPNDGRGSISMLFKPEKVLFVVDWIILGRMPWQKLWSYDIHGMIQSTKEVLALDFEYFVGGHGDTGSKSDVAAYLSYLEALYKVVIDGIHAGKSLEQLKKEIRLDEFKHLRMYKEWLPKNIEGVYERLMEESGMGWRPDID